MEQPPLILSQTIFSVLYYNSQCSKFEILRYLLLILHTKLFIDLHNKSLEHAQMLINKKYFRDKTSHFYGYLAINFVINIIVYQRLTFC